MRQISEILEQSRVVSEERRSLYYQTLVKETMRLQRLVESLLDFGRMEAGARKYRFAQVDVGALVRQVAADLESQAGGSGQRIQASGADGCRVEADPEALSTAVRNLLDNAMKYSPGQPIVWVDWKAEDRGVAIRVRDQGLGISASEQKIVFQKFVRGTSALEHNVKGTGVGLAIVNQIIAAHQGRIELTSEPGKGSTFTIWLPAGVKE
jgi:two-component system phosphate regulon sensor histidine kinase PhoR